MPTITEILRRALLKTPRTFQELEHATGVKRQSLMRFARGKQSLRLDMADALAEVLGLELKESAGMTGSQSFPSWWVFYLPGDCWDAEEAESWGEPDWTCNEKTVAGDYALLYVKQPVSAIVAVLRATDRRRRKANPYSPAQPWWCHVRLEATLKHPLTFENMRKDEELYEAWGLVRGQFQAPRGASPRIREDVLGLLLRRIPEVRSRIRDVSQTPKETVSRIAVRRATPKRSK